MIKPTISLHGTNPRELQRELIDVRTALNAALETVHHYPLHARDYSPGDFSVAVTQWREREKQVRAFAQEVYELAIHCQKEAERRRPALNWSAAEEHLKTVKEAYKAIGPTGLFVLTVVVPPLEKRLIEGERTVDLYEDIMGVKI